MRVSVSLLTGVSEKRDMARETEDLNAPGDCRKVAWGVPM